MTLGDVSIVEGHLDDQLDEADQTSERVQGGQRYETDPEHLDRARLGNVIRVTHTHTHPNTHTHKHYMSKS